MPQNGWSRHVALIQKVRMKDGQAIMLAIRPRGMHRFSAFTGRLQAAIYERSRSPPLSVTSLMVPDDDEVMNAILDLWEKKSHDPKD